MSVIGEIAQSWIRPRAVMRRQLQAGHREARLFGFLAIACLINLFGQVPRIYGLSVADPTIGLDARFSAAAFGWLFVAPLFFYLLAGIARLGARLLGGHGSATGARLALFWSLLAVAPVWFVLNLLSVFNEARVIYYLFGVVALFGFVTIWFLSLYESEVTGEAS